MPESFTMIANAAVATAAFGALGWVAHRLGKDIDTLWSAVEELRKRSDHLSRENAQTRLEAANAAKDYVTKTDIEKMEQRFERRLGESENRLLAAIRAGHRRSSAND